MALPRRRGSPSGRSELSAEDRSSQVLDRHFAVEARLPLSSAGVKEDMIPERYAPYVYAGFRFVVGFLFVFHGLQKFGLLPGSRVVAIISLVGLAGIIELICGALVGIGLFTRPAALIASGEMAFAYFYAHQPRGGWPIQNQGELAALYCFAFLYIAARGAGRLGLDRR